MRSLVLSLLVTMSATAHAGDGGFDWDPPPPASWELNLSSILQGQPDRNPYGGFLLGIEHRLDDRVWVGAEVGWMFSRQRDADMVLLPTQSATFFAATGRVRLARWESLIEEEIIEVGLRGELGNAFVNYENERTTPIITGAGVTGRIGTHRTNFVLTMGYALAFGGGRAEIHPGGIDVRMAVARSW